MIFNDKTQNQKCFLHYKTFFIKPSNIGIALNLFVALYREKFFSVNKQNSAQ